MAYPEHLIAPMRVELTSLGVQELRTPDAVDTFVAQTGTQMIVVNSVCGCAAGKARPGIAQALRHSVTPTHRGTVFAGADIAATDRARGYFTGKAPSSPSVAILRDGKLVYLMERHHIEMRGPDEIAAELKAAFDAFCQPAGATA